MIEFSVVASFFHQKGFHTPHVPPCFVFICCPQAPANSSGHTSLLVLVEDVTLLNVPMLHVQGEVVTLKIHKILSKLGTVVVNYISP